MTVDFDYVDKAGATYPTSGNSGFSARQTEDHVHYGSSTTSSTTSGDWVSIGSCLLYTSDAADEGLGVDLGGRRIIKKKIKEGSVEVVGVFVF